MADRYLLENGVDSYLLEDGSGVLLLEAFEQIEFDPASAATNGATDPVDLVYTPTYDLCGLALWIGQSLVSADVIFAVTINPDTDNIPMEKAGQENSTGSETGASYLYHKGRAFPAGVPITIRVDKTDGTTAIHVVAQGFNGPAGIVTAVEDYDGISTPLNVLNPEVTLQYNGKRCAAFGGTWSAVNAVGNAVELGTMTRIHDHDFTNDVSICSRQITPGTADFTFGYTINQVSGALSAMAVAMAVAVVTEVEISGSVSGTGSATGALSSRHALAGSVSGAGSTSGVLVNLQPLAGTISGAGASSAAIVARIPISGSVSGQGTTTGDAEVVTFQYGYPTSDIAAGGWTTDTGSSVDLFDAVNEEPPVDTDFIQSPVDPSAAAVELKFEPFSPPEPGAGTLYLRHRRV